MSFWFFILIAVLILWGLHVQRLHENRRKVEDELKGLKSAKKDMESTLVSRGRRLDVLFSAVNEVVMRVDRLGRVMAANRHANHMFTMDAAADLPQSMLVFYRNPDWHRAFSLALKTLPEATSLPDIHINGKVLAPRLAPLGREQALLLCVDVTEKYRAEQQRKSLFANLMHDLKTPLTSILGYARSMEAFGDDEQLRREAVQVIADESVRANEFLDALLTLEHVESFKPDPSEKALLGQVADAVIHAFASQLEEKGVEMMVAGDLAGVEVRMAESNLHRILDNLMENALRYTPQGSQIMMRGTSIGKRYQLEIIDQGNGVPEKALPRLTERFYRANQARSRREDGGHGLGLAIVKELLEKHDGSLKLENHDQYGLSVTFSLPLAD